MTKRIAGSRRQSRTENGISYSLCVCRTTSCDHRRVSHPPCHAPEPTSSCENKHSPSARYS